MMSAFFPVKKLRRHSKYLVIGAILLVVVAVYHEMVALKAWTSDTSMNADGSSWRRATFDNRFRKDHHVEDSAAWRSSHTPQSWKPEYQGLANLHVFEDWCGSSVADLFKNMHYPLYPHSRTTVQKLAVSPQWTNYGLRIFGYLHPYTDGEFVFSLSSDDNSEFWLSTDDSPLNVQLLAWVGKTGTEWTAPGEFDKYASQTSRPVRLSAQRRYFFEVIHKQNDRGTDHVEVAWQLLDQDLGFMVIESNYISLYINESALLLSDVAHIPETAASHQHTPTKQHGGQADMLMDDPRDSLHQVPLINNKFLQGILPDCSYKPSYIIKDLTLLRYQGLQFVHMSYVYPNDYTRLTHMETQESCFYSASSYYMKRFRFYSYMRLDRPDMQRKGNAIRDFDFRWRKSEEIRPDQMDNTLFPDYGDDYDDYNRKRRRKLFSLAMQETNTTLMSTSDTTPQVDELQRRRGKDGVLQSQKPVEPHSASALSVPSQASKRQLHLQHHQTALNPEGQVTKVEQIKPKVKLRSAKRQKRKSVERAVRARNGNPVISVDREQIKTNESPVITSQQLSSKQRSRKTNYTQIQSFNSAKPQPSERNASLPEENPTAKQWRSETKDNRPTTPKREDSSVRLNQRVAEGRKHYWNEEMRMNTPPQQDLGNSIYSAKLTAGGNMDTKRSDTKGEEDQAWEWIKVRDRDMRGSDLSKGERDFAWTPREDFEDADDEDLSAPLVFDTEINWNQTFQVSQLDLQAQRRDSIDLHCNISGNLLLRSSDALPVIKAFVDRLNQQHHGQFTLVRVVNVVKRVDEVYGSRYLLELELKDGRGHLLRLSHYIYSLTAHSRRRRKEIRFRKTRPRLVLCNPVGFHWNPDVTVHFIVPVKDQARWVQQLIADMEQVFRDTQDANFNVIIADYSSTDMDVRKALQKSSLPRYQYVKLSGNFERSAGLQAGVDIIDDDHSIVFLCDLHIHFPPSIIDTIRKHCVEGYMAFAPILMRLNCGATPIEARGYWEVNGFGLLGIYKSDLDAVGGMNTREFRDSWGGEDWELLDRILQAGLEVDRIYLRNFFHYYHSKRGMWNRRLSPRHR